MGGDSVQSGCAERSASIRGDDDPERRSAGSALLHAWSVLDRDRRLAAVAAVALFVTMFLPWYQQNAVVSAVKAERWSAAT